MSIRSIAIAISFGAILSLVGSGSAHAVVVIEPGAQDDTNGIPGIDRGDPANGIPPDQSLRTKRFRTIQGALYALRRNLISDTVIEIRGVGPFNAHEPNVPAGVPRHIDVSVGITIRGAGTSPTVVAGGTVGVRVSSSAGVTLENLVIRGASAQGVVASGGGGTSGPALTLNRVQVTGTGGSGIIVNGTTLTLSRVQIGPTGAHGIVARQASTLNGRDVDVTNAFSDGICVIDRSTSHLIDVEIKDGGGFGFVADDSPANLIEGGQITNNANGGAYARAGSVMLIRGLGATRSTISNNPSGHGVTYSGNSYGSVIDTDVDNNGQRGISARQTTNRLLFSDINVRNNGGDGIFADQLGRFILRRAVVHNNGNFGVYLNLIPDALVEKNRITENDATGLFALGPGTAIIRDNPEIRANEGRGVSISDEMQGEIRSNVIRDNHQNGVSVRRTPVEFSIIDNKIISNSKTPTRAAIGGGIVVIEQSTARIQGNTISDNRSISSGGGIAIIDSAGFVGGLSAVQKNTISLNQAKDGVGGGLACTGRSRIELVGNEFENNKAIHGANTGAASGGGVAILARCKATILGNYFKLNRADDHGGGLYIKDSPTTVIGGRQRTDVNRFETNSTVNGNGGGLLIEGGSNEVRGNSFTGNTAASPQPDRGLGGGIAVFGGYNGQIVGNRLDNNTAKVGGGLYSRDAKPTIGDGTLFGENTIVRNAATKQIVIGVPPAVGEGAGIALHNAEGALINMNTIGRNVGNAIHISGGKLNKILNNFIGRDRQNNPMPNDGHGLVLADSSENTVGPANAIAHNVRDGIAATGGTSINNRFTQNLITANIGWGIRLSGLANGKPPPPVLTAVSAASVDGQMIQPSGSRVEVFQDTNNEAAEYLGNATVGADGRFHFAHAGLSNNGLNVTLTVTDLNGNTSEISNALLQIVQDSAAPARTIDMSDPAMTHVNFGRWGADIGGVGGGLTGYIGGVPPAVRNAVGTAANAWNNFIDRDPNRIYVRLRDYRLDADPSAVDTTTTNISTTRVVTFTFGGVPLLPVPLPDDNPTQITLVETGSNTGIFASESQMIVGPDVYNEPFTDTNRNCQHDAGEAFTDLNGNGNYDTDNADDDFAVRSTAGVVCDDQAEDRSHRATVDGEVVLTYQPVGAVAGQNVEMKIPVCERNPERRHRLEVMIYNFNEPWIDIPTPPFTPGRRDANEPFIDISAGSVFFGLGGTWGPIWTTAQIDRQMLHLRSYLAVDCIRVHELGRTVLNPGPVLFTTIPGFTDGLGDAAGNRLSADERAIHPAMRSAVNIDVNPNNDIVDLYLVAPLNHGAPDNFFAVQWRPGYAATQPGVPANIANLVMVGLNSATQNVPGAFPHELGHQLTNRPDMAGVPQYMYFPSSGAAAGDSTTYLTLRRIQHARGTQIKTTPRAGIGGAGNNLLRVP
ncbi:right-handed parallel beta-helix repeat-containing protein [Mesorhizobium sp. 10J20-29]